MPLNYHKTKSNNYYTLSKRNYKEVWLNLILRKIVYDQYSNLFSLLPDRRHGCPNPSVLFHSQNKYFQIRQKCSLEDIRRLSNSEIQEANKRKNSHKGLEQKEKKIKYRTSIP